LSKEESLCCRSRLKSVRVSEGSGTSACMTLYISVLLFIPYDGIQTNIGQYYLMSYFLDDSRLLSSRFLPFLDGWLQYWTDLMTRGSNDAMIRPNCQDKPSFFFEFFRVYQIFLLSTGEGRGIRI
jgi:hypothetical protein